MSSEVLKTQQPFHNQVAASAILTVSPYQLHEGAMALSPENQGINEIGETYLRQAVVVPWTPGANMLRLDLYHICEMMGLLADDDEYPDEYAMRARLRDRYITHWQQLQQQR